MVLAFVLGLVIASAATAGASTLITGSQIKDGTIQAKDLNKALRTQLKRVGPRGPQGLPGPAGPQGPKGDAGPLTTTLPAGQTLRGAFNLDTPATGASQVSGQAISFGLSLRAAPTLVVRPVGAAPNSQCPGTVGDPQAAASVLCVYLSSAFNLASGLSVQNFPSANPFGAELFIFSAAAGRFYADGTWAVTGN